MLNGYGKRVAQAVTMEIRALVRMYGIDRLLFMTLTFPDAVGSFSEAQSRWHSLRTAVLSRRYERSVVTVERTKRGVIHWHLIAVLPVPLACRSSFDWAAWDRAAAISARGGSKTAAARFHTWQYGKTACSVLRAEWDYWCRIAPRYGFGRVTSLPIRKGADECSRYVAKYVCKAYGDRDERDVGARLVRFVGYVKNWSWKCALTGNVVTRRTSKRTHGCQFGWHTVRGKAWRGKVDAYVRRMGQGDVSEGQFRLRALAGAKWLYAFRCSILLESISAEWGQRAGPEVVEASNAAIVAIRAETCGLANFEPAPFVQLHQRVVLSPSGASTLKRPAKSSPLLGEYPEFTDWPESN